MNTAKRVRSLKQLNFKKHFLFSCLALAVCLVVLCASTGLCANLSASVTDQHQNPLEGAKVYLYTASDDYAGRYAYTAADGAADLGEIDTLDAGSYKLKAKYLGRETWSDPLTLPDQSQAAVVINTALVNVTVSYAGQTAADSKVYLYSDTDSCLSRYQITGTDGQAEFSLPVGGAYKFRASLLSQYYWSEALTVSADAANSVAIDAGGGQLAVTLQKEAAAPLADITLKLYNPQGCHLGQSAVSQADGSAVFAVSAGTYRIRADYLGHQFWSADTPVDSDTNVVISIAHQAVTISLDGLFDGDPTPIEGAKMKLYTDTGCGVSLSAYTDAAGQVTFALPVKPYKVCAYYLGQTYWSDIFSGADADVQVPMAEADVAVTWSGAPLEGVPVQLFTETGGWTGVKQTTDAAGKARFDVPAGTWQFRADYQSNQYWSTGNDLSADLTTAIELSTGGGALSLTVAKDDGTPLEGLHCCVYNANGAWTGVKGATNSQGLVDLDLAEGSYKIRIDYLGHQFWSEIYTITAAMADNFQIPHTDVHINVNGVFDTTRTPVADVIVKLYTGLGSWTPLDARTDAAGEAVFSLPEKEYKVRVDYLKSETWSPVFTAADTNVDIALADVEITVTGAGHGLENAKVKVYTESDVSVGAYGYSDADGRITFRLPQGSYKFRAEYLGHTFWSEAITPAAGQTTPLEIATGGGNFTLTVLKDAQSPIVNAKCYLYNQAGTTYLGLWAYTDENGQARFDLVDGNFSFKVKYLGYTYVSDAVQVPQSLDQSLTIAHTDVELTVNGVLSSATPIEGAKVYLYTASGGWLGLTQYSDADGHVIYSLPAGDYKAKVYYLGRYFWSDPFNSRDAAINIPMAKAQVTVSGAGQQFEGIKVYAYTGTGGWLGVSDRTDHQGAVTFRLPSGDFKFAAYYQGKKFYSDAVTLDAARLTKISIDTGGGIFRLKVQKDVYHPIGSVRCYVYTDSESCTGIYGTTDAQGNVEFALSDGGYKFKIKYAGNYFWSDAVAVPDTLSHTLTLDHQRYPIFARGINPGPEPLVHIKFNVYTAAGNWIDFSGYTDDEGNIAFDLPSNPDGYKAKYYYDGQTLWTPLLKPTGTLVTINQGDGDVPAAVEGLTAAINADNHIELAWTASADAGTAGYAIYRRHLCESGFTRITADLLPADATAYTDTSVSPPGSYTYFIAAVSADGVQGYPSGIAAAGFGGQVTEVNTAAVTNLTAAWNQGRARLAWDPLSGYQYQIYRGADPAALAPWQRTTTIPYEDDSANPYQTWYYQVASVKTLCDPVSGEPIEKIGPLSALMTLAALSAPIVSGDGLQLDADGNYVIVTGPSGGYTLSGSYSGFTGDVIITATLGDQTITGSGSNGRFSIDLPHAGDWQITISDADGWQSAIIQTDWQIDDQPPSLAIDGATARTTTESMIQITGVAADTQSALQGVNIASDRYPGMTFGTTVGAMGDFSGEVPLKVGDNLLTVSAADIHGNTRSKTITATQTLTALPVLQITSPADGARVTVSRVNVSGTVRSSLPPEQIRLVMGDQIVFSTGSNNAYTFAFNNIDLAPGSNVLQVRAETPHGNVTAQVTVDYSDAQADQAQPPQIEILSPLPGSYLAQNPVVSGLVTGPAAIESVSVNGQPAQTTGLGSTNVSFQASVAFGALESETIITVAATDSADQSASVSMTVYPDSTPPVISLQNTGLQPPPAVNTVTQSPYVVTGTVTEANMAGLLINDQSVSLTPAAGADTFDFSAGLLLTYNQQAHIVLTALDLAGNRTGTEFILNLSSNLNIEVIQPAGGAQLQGQGATIDVAVTVRVAGAAADDVFIAAIDDNDPVTLTRTGDVGNANLSAALARDDHRLSIEVQNSTGTTIAGTATSFSTQNMDTVPLAVERQTPANNATGIEPNDFIALYFNKAIDPELLQIEVLETVHGLTYAAPVQGADLTELSNVEMVQVHRDREPVPGGISHFPYNRMAAFYPSSDLAYGASVFVTVTYDGTELLRSTYSVRELPTLIEGFVLDSADNALEHIQVSLPDLGLSTFTNADGAYNFGFGMQVKQKIPDGRHKIIVNPGMQNANYGTLAQWVRARQAKRNTATMIKLPVISNQIPFRRIVSGQADTLLVDGALKLDLSQAELSFADLRNQGDVHVQFLTAAQVLYAPLSWAAPLWMFCTQPAGVTVSGQVGLTLAIPQRTGSYAYLDDYGERVVLVGLDPQALMIVPVGVGRIDADTKTVVSQGRVHLQCLDFIGYAPMTQGAQPLLEQYVQDEITLQQLIADLENMQ